MRGGSRRPSAGAAMGRKPASDDRHSWSAPAGESYHYQEATTQPYEYEGFHPYGSESSDIYIGSPANTLQQERGLDQYDDGNAAAMNEVADMSNRNGNAAGSVVMPVQGVYDGGMVGPGQAIPQAWSEQAMYPMSQPMMQVHNYSPSGNGNVYWMQPVFMPVYNTGNYYGMQEPSTPQQRQSQAYETSAPSQRSAHGSPQVNGGALLARKFEASLKQRGTITGRQEVGNTIDAAKPVPKKQANRKLLRREAFPPAQPTSIGLEKVADARNLRRESEDVSTAVLSSNETGNDSSHSDPEFHGKAQLGSHGKKGGRFDLMRPSHSHQAADDCPEDILADTLLSQLDENDDNVREAAFQQVFDSFWPLTLSKRGCRVVQHAVDVGSPAYQHELLEQLRGRVIDALRCPHGNYVLQKFIQTCPSEHMQFVLDELHDQGFPIIARHRFGCRILLRLIEHCSASQTEPMIEEILSDTSLLCRHQYGNFVIQHILQHSSTAHRSAIADVVCNQIIRFAKHRLASHVVSCALAHCPTEDVRRMTHAVLHDAGQLADVSRREYGSFVVREVKRAAKMLQS